MNTPAQATANERTRNNASSKTGCSTTADRHTNAANSATPPPRAPSTDSDPQPQSGACTIANEISPTPTASSPTPTASGTAPRSGSRVSTSSRRAGTHAAAPSRRSTKNTSRQSPHSISNPPSEGPVAAATPPTAPQS